MSYQATVYAENGQPVKLRAEPSANCSSYTNIKVGTPAEVIGENDDWAYIMAGTRQGYMQRKFLRTADTPTQDPSHDTPAKGQQATQDGLLYQTVQQARAQLEAGKITFSVKYSLPLIAVGRYIVKCQPVQPARHLQKRLIGI